MKWILILAIFILSCSRDNDLNNEQPEISFDIEGGHYKFTGYQTPTNGGVGVLAYKVTVLSYSDYIFSGILNLGNFTSIDIGTGTDTLKTISYISGGTLKASGGDYVLNGLITVSITSYQNGVVSGTFSGRASKIIYSNPITVDTVQLTNGFIKNVRINY